MPIFPDQKPPLDRTGAGDAYAATFVSGLILGKTIPEALAWAGVNSMSVVHYVGAQKGLLDQARIKKYLSYAPIDYQVRLI